MSDIISGTKKRKINKRLVIVVIVAVVLIGVGISVYLYLRGTSKDNTGGNVTNQTEQDASIAVNNAAQAASSKGDTNQALKVYDDAIKGASSDRVAGLYADKSLFALNSGDLDAAVEAAEDAIAKIDPSVEKSKLQKVYYAAAAAYEEKKDYKKALDYYQKAYDSYKAIGEMANTSTKEAYEETISSLKAKI